MATTSTRREKVSYMDSHWDTSYQYDTHDPPVGYFPNFSLSFTKRPKIEIKRYDQTSQIQF